MHHCGSNKISKWGVRKEVVVGNEQCGELVKTVTVVEAETIGPMQTVDGKTTN